MISAERRRTVVIPILLTCAAYACYNVCDATLKLLAGKYHFTQVIFFNATVSIILLSVHGAVREGRRAFSLRLWKPAVVRGLLSQVISVCNVFALPHLHLTTFYTIVFTSPFIVALLSMVFLKEKARARQLGVILAGFAVVLCVFRPGGGLLDIWVLAALLGAICYSCQLVIVRHATRKFGGASRTFLFIASSVMSALWTAPLLPAHFVTPTAVDLALTLLIGLCSVTGLVCITRAFETASSAAVVAPYHYTQLLWAALLGWAVFGEVPDPRVMGGAAAIIALGLYMIYTESRVSRIPDAEKAAEL